MRKKTLFIAIGIISIISIAGVIIWKNNNISSELILVKRGTLVQDVSATGKVEFPTKIDLHFKNSGKLVAINTGIGKKVSAGQLLAKQDTGELDAQVSEMKAGIELQQAKLDQLLGGASDEEVSLSQITLDQTKNTQEILVKNAYENMLNSTIEAVPEDGDSDYIAPIISGTYNLGKEGTIKISSYYSSGGTSFNVTGLTSGTGLSNTITAQPIGNSGLYIKFPNNTNINVTDWIINIPNKKASDYLANYNAYQSALSQAKSLIDQRTAELALKKAPARSLDVAVYQAQVNQAKALLQKIQSQRNELMIIAPSSGLITKINGEIGEIINPDKPVISFVAENVLQIKLNIIEDKIANINVGQEAEITFDAIENKKFSGKIVSIDPTETEVQGAVYYETTIIFDKVDESVKSGMTANVLVRTAIREDVLFVPVSAVQIKNNIKYVQILENKKIISKEVTTGIKNGVGMIEITSGLEEGEQVIISNQSKK
ncbi:MAG: efflux RND transporter periplasmic adaptor subunit [Candidatus Pacebacteria bacterium]|nr:efflux RND transporter periplasmic adaptor subunit [Candidatus Paceibacterota bacterium]